MSTPEERFAVVFESTYRPLLGYALRRVVDAADAADVVAETFLVAWRRIEDVPTGDEARPWLFGVARRVLANWHRGERRRTALTGRLRQSLSEIAPPPNEGLSDIEDALRALGSDDQEILRLVAWEELARDEIAIVLGISRGAVRVRLHRARRRLTERMDQLAAQDEELNVAGRKRLPRTGHVINGWAPARPGVEEAR